MDKAIISPEAQADLQEILSYIALDNATSARDFLDQTFELIDVLAANPLLGRLSRFEVLKRMAVRVCPIPAFKKYIIFYRSKPLQIIRVLHGARDLDELF